METKVAEHVGKTYSYFHNALRAMQGGSVYHFYDGLWYEPARIYRMGGGHANH